MFAKGGLEAPIYTVARVFVYPAEIAILAERAITF